MKRHLEDTNHLADHPSVRLCRFALLEIGDMVEFGVKSTAVVASQQSRDQAVGWLALLDSALACAGALEGTQTRSDKKT